jgi:hypothetical protein
MYATLLGLVVCFFNMLDACLTSWEVSNGFAEESNPIMEYWMSNLGDFFCPAKILFVSLLIVSVFWHYEKSRLAKLGLHVATVAYSTVLVIHLVGLYNL